MASMSAPLFTQYEIVCWLTVATFLLAVGLRLKYSRSLAARAAWFPAILTARSSAATWFLSVMDGNDTQGILLLSTRSRV